MRRKLQRKQTTVTGCTTHCPRVNDPEESRSQIVAQKSVNIRQRPRIFPEQLAQDRSIQFGAIQLFKHTCLVEAFPGPRRVAWAAPFSSPFREHGPEHAGALYIVMYFLLGTADNSEPGGDEGGGS